MVITLTQKIDVENIYNDDEANELAMDLEYWTRNVIQEKLDSVPLSLETDYKYN